jgi:hypothetical protein
MADRQEEAPEVVLDTRVDHDMVDSLGVHVDHEPLDIADRVAICAQNREPVEIHHRIVDVSRIEITKP